MFCKQCGYRLWNLTSRNCPECGLAFRPSEFDFVPNSVEFRCPHCAQGYFGTDVRGHLFPPAFECVACHKPISMDEMILLPTRGVEEEQTRVGTMPWLEREKIGVVRAWFRTVGMALIRPGKMMEMTPTTGTTGQAVWFAVITSVAVGLTALLFALAIMVPMVWLTAGGGPGGAPGWAVVSGISGVVLGYLVVSFFLGLLWAVIAHGLLRLTGPSEHGLSRTVQSMCFASGANVVTMVPCLGGYIGWIWWMVSAVVALRSAQRVGGGRASFAVITPPLVVFGLFIALVAFSLGRAATLTAAGGAWGPYAAGGQTAGAVMPVFDALKAYAADHNGAGPKHAAELLLDDYALLDIELVTDESNTPLDSIPLGSATLDGFEELPPLRKDAAVQAAIAALPADVVAHRLGDCVFTYHGMDLTTADPKSWLFVRLAPISPGSPLMGYSVVCVDGSTVFYVTGQPFTAALREQNDLRRKSGLPPLPDPATVTHDKPASASSTPTGGEGDSTSQPDDDEKPDLERDEPKP